MALTNQLIKNIIPLFLSFLLLLPYTVFAAESQKYPNIIALGNISPIASEEGLPSPIIIWKHQSSTYPGDATLDVFLKTSTLTAGFTHQITSEIKLGYEVSGTILTEGYGSDIYINGSRTTDLIFVGNSLMINIIAWYPFNEFWSIQAAIARQSLWFEDAEKNSSDFTLPDNHEVDQNTATIYYEGSVLSDKDEFKCVVSNGKRSQWHDWGLDNNASSKKEYNQFRLKLKNTFKQHEFGYLTTSLSAGTGTDMDIISGYRIGGMAGQYVVVGYYRNEFRVKDAVVLNISQEIEFAKDRKLKILADIASFRRFDFDYLDATPKAQTIGGLGLSYYYGIRSLQGLPIIIAYGEGLNVHKDSKENHRREISVVTAVAF
jgi:hypothetical protein